MSRLSGSAHASSTQHQSKKSIAPSVQAIDHVHVFVANRLEAKEWYARVLGMNPVAELEFWAKDGGPLTIADKGDTFHIALFESAVIECRSTIALKVSALDFVAWKAHLKHVLQKDVTVEDHEVSWSLYFSDPDGNPYEVTTYEYQATSKLEADD
jgi:catechol-2,3-dioxygenase